MRIFPLVFYTFGFFLFTSTWASAQKDALAKANDFINERDYQSALLQLNQLPTIETSTPLLFKRARCYFELNELDKALAEISKVQKMGYKDEDILYYKGRVFHHLGNFRQAIDSYKNYLRETSTDDEKRPEIREHVKHCGAAMDILYVEPLATIENAGPSINSGSDDERLVQSAGIRNRYYFSSDRPDRSEKVSSYLSKSYSIDASSDMDIYHTDISHGEWQQAEKLSDRKVNTYKNDQLADVSLDGASLYLLHGEEEMGLKVESPSTEVKRRIKLLSEVVEDDPHFHFFNDSTVIFASDRLEGFGGYDLYVTAFVGDKWLRPKNLGRELNSYYDEISPYLSNDGSTLYFSSNRSFSVGGFDIFYSEYQFEQKIWTVPKNMGIPVNSPGNETHFRLSDDGLLGSYTSDRKDGYGQNDLYLAYLNEKNEHQSFTVKDLGFVDYPDFYLKNSARESVVTNNPKPIRDDLSALQKIEKPPPPLNRKESVTLPILTPDVEGNVSTRENMLKINELAAVLVDKHDILLEVMSYSHLGGIAEYNLFLSIKNAEKIKEAIVERGISSERIKIKGFGDYLPIIKSSVNDEEIIALNNRIEFKVNLPAENYEIESESFDINKSYLNKGYEVYRTLVDDAISYKIQIATVRQMYRGTALKLYNDVQVEKDPNTGNYLYSIGLYNDFIEANSIMRELSEKGITALKLVAYVDGLRVEEKNLVDYVARYPELKDYIRSITFAQLK